MFEDFILSGNYSFSKEEKEKCLPVINQICKLAEIAECEGLLRLKEEVQEDSYQFFIKIGIELIVDGTDPNLVEHFLQNLMLSEDYTGAEFMKRLMAANGVLMIQRGVKLREIRKYLFSFFGEMFMQQMVDVEKKTIYKRYFKLLDAIRDKTTLPECEEFANYIKLMSNQDYLIRWIDTKSDNDFVPALMGCGSDIIKLVLRNVSLNKSIDILLRRLSAKEEDLEDIIHAQKNFLNWLKNMKKEGEIVISHELLLSLYPHE